MFPSRRILLSTLALTVLLIGPLRPNPPTVRGQEGATAENVQGADAEAASSSELKTDEQKTPSFTTARQTMRDYVRAMETKDYRTAVKALDFSSLEPAPDTFQQVEYGQRLKACLDRMALIEFSEIDNDPDGPPFAFPPDEPDAQIVVKRCDDGLWKFAASTVAEIDTLYEVLKDEPLIGEKAVAAVKPTPDEDTKPADSTAPSESAVESEASKAAIQSVPEGLQSARRTMRTLMESFEPGGEYASTDGGVLAAVAALDFSEMEAKAEAEDPEMGLYMRQDYALRLKQVIERMALIDYASISDNPADSPFRFPPDAVNQPIEISRNEAGIWRFSARTVARIDALHKMYKDKPVLNRAKAWYDRELILGNETWRILSLFVAVFSSLLLGQLLRAVFRWRADTLKRRERLLRSAVLMTLAKSVTGVLFLIGLNLGITVLVLEFKVQALVTTVIHVIFVVVVGYISFRLVDVIVEMLRDVAKRTGSTLNDMLVPIVSTALRLTIIVLVVLEIATAISDQPPSAVLAGLGAGGLAIGLAAQDTIKNLFGSMMIFVDRPFELGDRVVFDGHDGPVEAVGFRSTRIRTLDGHLVTVPNGEMANRTLHNIGKRPYIRRVMNIRLAYDTAPEKIERALEVLRELLADHEGQKEERPPRVFLHEFLDTAINLRAIYWYHPPDYWDYCEHGGQLNMQIIERFRAEGIRFFIPAQRLFMEGDS